MAYSVLTISTVVASVAIAYAWWIYVRVMWLREDLFNVRDALFDLAMERGRLKDPAYLLARGRVNAMIRMAGTFNLHTVVFLSTIVPDRSADDMRSSDQVLQGAIDSAYHKVGKRLFKYITRQTLTGCLLWLLAWLVRPVVQREGESAIEKGIRSPFPEQLSPCI
jgi:hypothetical protein